MGFFIEMIIGKIWKKLYKKKKHPEKKLENCLKKNLKLYHNGLKFIAQQYRCSFNYKDIFRFIQIDILSQNVADGTFILIEVKTKAHLVSLQQMNFYLKTFSIITQQKCKGIIAALSFSKKLLKANNPYDIKFWDLTHLNIQDK